MTRIRLSAALPCLLLAAAPRGQQPAEDWALRLPFASPGAAIALHPQTGRPTRFGGWSSSIGGLPDLWEWTGATWARHATSPGPAVRIDHAMATDDQRRQLVLFGGRYQAGDTWTFDGAQWTARPTPLLLTARSGHAMAHDSRRGRIVLFGGDNGLNDTWEWDGSAWLLRQPGAPPPARQGHRLAFDAARGNMVLFGGRSGTTALGDTWTWDGTFWRQHFPAHAPGARSHPAMSWDPARQRVVLFGGSSVIFPIGTDDTWEWDGADWARVSTPHRPPPLLNPSLAFDRTRNRTVLFGPNGTDAIWEYDGIDWTQVVRASAPLPRIQSAIADDPVRGEAVLFGGIGGSTNHGDTWLWNGQRWSEARPPLAPSARAGHGLAFDPARSVTVLFGGFAYPNGGSLTSHDDTWTWNGSVWREVLPAHRPPQRNGHGLAFHVPTQRLVLFGGRDNATLFGDTWTFDGVDWTQAASANPPPARCWPVLIGTRQQVVLFGGSTWTTSPYQSQELDDTWTWGGTTWTRLQPTTSPSGRHLAAATYDGDRDRVLVCSGSPTPTSATAPADTWAFDGTTWSPVATATAPLVRTGAVLVHDPRLHQVVLFGGLRAGYQDDTWTLATAGGHEAFGAGCAGSLGVPMLQASPHSVAEPGGTVLVLVQNLPTSMAVMAMGFSDTTTGAVSLPLALDPYGMPGCRLLVAPDAARVLAGSGNAATWVLALPFATRFLGAEFFYQAFAFDPGANAAGLTASEGGRCRIGN